MQCYFIILFVNKSNDVFKYINNCKLMVYIKHKYYNESDS